MADPSTRDLWRADTFVNHNCKFKCDINFFSTLLNVVKAFGGTNVVTLDSIGNTLNRQVAVIGKPIQSCARVSDWPISIQNWVYIFPSVEFSIYVLTF